MRFALVCALLVLSLRVHAGELPVVDDFRIVPQYPPPVAGAELTRGAAVRNTGQFVLWDGDAVYVQELIDNIPGPLFNVIGSGYAGNPSFVEVQTNNRTAFLGDGDAGVILRYPDLATETDFDPSLEIPATTHQTGALLTDRFLVLDRFKDDAMSPGAELVLVDLNAPIPTRGTDEPPRIGSVLEKPPNSAPAAMALNRARTLLFVMDGATGELRSFTVSALSDALLDSSVLDWEMDGTLIAEPGELLRGGVAGVTPRDELVIPGNGAIQIVAPGPPLEILLAFDPAGTSPPFQAITNFRLDEIVAIDPVPMPPDVYATFDGIPPIPPDTPSDELDEIRDQFAAFLAAFFPESTDLDGDGVRDSAIIELVGLFAARDFLQDEITNATNSAFDDNLEVFAGEANAPALADFDRIIPLLLFLNTAMQDAVLTRLSDADTPLTGVYASVSCDALDVCTPDFVEDAFFPARGVVMPFEPYFGSGDPDNDGFTNLEEFENSVAVGGNDFDFAVAAASDRLNGDDAITNGSVSSSGCFIATAAYGTPVADDLRALRAYRDDHLLTSRVGTSFVDVYYRLSPAVADAIATRPVARLVTRSVIDFVWSLLSFVRPQTVTILVLLSILVVSSATHVLGRQNK